jgi:hypothetical protein
MAAGSLAAHALSYAFVSVRIEGATEVSNEAHALAERSSTGLASHSVLLLATVAALASVAAFRWLLGRGSPRSASPWLFFALPPVAFCLQELIERLLHAEAAPFQAVFEPRFLIGLALQVPLGFAALLVARRLLQVVRRIARAWRRQRPVLTRRRSSVCWLPTACELPRIPALALGYPQRGPPTL